MKVAVDVDQRGVVMASVFEAGVEEAHRCDFVASGSSSCEVAA